MDTVYAPFAKSLISPDHFLIIFFVVYVKVWLKVQLGETPKPNSMADIDTY